MFDLSSNAGTGFIPWQFLSSVTPTSGYALYSSAANGLGDIDTNGKSFMLYAWDDME